MPNVETYLREHRSKQLDDLAEFLAIPSVSALPAHREDVRRAATWAANYLREIGFPRVDLLETAGHPSVYAEWTIDHSLPTVLIYGHIDVQPADPLAEWERPPFEPLFDDGKVYARGACDDKGCLFIPITAVEALAAVDGQPPLNVKFLLEGEEEIGSPHLPPLLQQYKDLLQADLVLCADGGFHEPGQPSLTLGSRGLCALEIEVFGPRSDFHSGMYGGTIRNPLQALATLLATLHTPDGKVAVAGFYDQVEELTASERAALARVTFSEADFLQETGAPQPFGEPGYSTNERRWTRPTLEINGLEGGFQGEGIKTVLPARGKAKVTCRLVPNQDPDTILAAIENHVQNHTPAGVQARCRPFPGSARAYVVDSSHPAIAACAAVLEEVYGQPPAYTRTGGTLPVAEMVSAILKRDFIFFSFGDPDTRVHAPNEFLRLDSFDKGVRSYIRLFETLSTGENIR